MSFSFWFLILVKLYNKFVLFIGKYSVEKLLLVFFLIFLIKDCRDWGD